MSHIPPSDVAKAGMHTASDDASLKNVAPREGTEGEQAGKPAP